MIRRESWLPQAQELAPGRTAYIEHECGEGRKLKIGYDQRGFWCWCFRCGEGDTAPPPRLSVAEKLALAEKWRKADEAMARPELPEPRLYVVGEWPPEAALWLYTAGLGKAEIGELGAYYHPPSDRVVLPVPGPSGGIAFWQARAYPRRGQPQRQPKYMSPEADRTRVIARWGAAEKPTLTEDILSAFKVSLSGGEGIALMGTVVNTVLVTELMRRAVRVNVWLDPDPAGQRGAARVMRQLHAYGIEHRNIVSPDDPKAMPRAAIKELIA